MNMATYHAIAAVLETVLSLLESKAPTKGFGGAMLKFKVVQSRDLDVPPPSGITLYLYGVTPNPNLSDRPPGRLNPDGGRLSPPLYLDLHFLLTAWARDARLQQEITGWMMRQMENTSLLSAAMLNQHDTGVFAPEETVEVSLETLTTEQMLGIWKAASPKGYQTSVPYIVRRVVIDS
jgi:hypothetical protein